jgi:poly-gamma-glutamate capsule biosynthesis protein CapA/YwtB (metallophosphatase superfamily)
VVGAPDPVDATLGRGGDLLEGLAGQVGQLHPLEAVNGPIPRPVDFFWPWGDALQVLDEAAPDVRVVNLETSITRGDEFAPGKAVHYRMHPANLPCLAAARPDACVLANNHVLDFATGG